MASDEIPPGTVNSRFACPSCRSTNFVARVWTMGFQEVDVVADHCGDAFVTDVSDYTEMVYDEQRWTAVLCASCEHDVSGPASKPSADLDLSGARAAMLARAIDAYPPARASLPDVSAELRRVAGA